MVINIAKSESVTLMIIYIHGTSSLKRLLKTFFFYIKYNYMVSIINRNS